ncbi:hypothetical protein ACTXT7_011305 [Hymenolepis weldensis]
MTNVSYIIHSLTIIWNHALSFVIINAESFLTSDQQGADAHLAGLILASGYSPIVPRCGVLITPIIDYSKTVPKCIANYIRCSELLLIYFAPYTRINIPGFIFIHLLQNFLMQADFDAPRNSAEHALSQQDLSYNH